MDFRRRYGLCFYVSIATYFVLFYIFYLPQGKAINIVSPFAFNVYVIPIKLPVQIGSSLTSLVALGALVVAKLALIGTTLLKGHHNEEEYSIPFNIAQPHGGWTPPGPIGHRKRRKASFPEEMNAIPEDAQQRVLAAIYKKDSHGCLLKFVCELGTIADKRQLGLEEQLILTLFRQSSLASSSGAVFSFSTAFRIGENNKNAKVCSKYFPRCTFNSRQMMSFYYKMRPKTSHSV